MSTPPKAKRLLRNFLLDARFQLKFTAYLVLAALAIALLLGAFLWRSSQTLAHQTQDALEARSRAAETSRELGNVALSSTLLEHVNDPAFAADLQRRSKDIDQQYEHEREAIEAQRVALARQERWTWLGLIVALGAFIVFIAAAGIVMTHRIAGPIFRMKRMAAEIGEGKLLAPDRALRPGDELQDLFGALAKMIMQLRALHRADLEVLERAATEAERAGLGAVATELRALQERLRERIAPASPR